MAARVATNVTLAVQSTLGAASNAATVLTLANPGVVTIATHGFSNGDYLVATSIDGMVELDGQAVRIANSTTNTFELEGLDTSSFTALVASSTTFKKVTAFTTLSNATNLTLPDAPPAKLDATKLIDKAKQYLFGLPDTADGSISTLYDPQVTAVAKIKAATLANTTLVMKITWSNGYKTLLNAYVSGGQGFVASQNTIVTANVSVTPVKQILEFTT